MTNLTHHHYSKPLRASILSAFKQAGERARAFAYVAGTDNDFYYLMLYGYRSQEWHIFPVPDTAILLTRRIAGDPNIAQTGHIFTLYVDTDTDRWLFKLIPTPDGFADYTKRDMIHLLGQLAR